MAVRFKSIAGKVSAAALAFSTLALPAAATAQQTEERLRDNEAAGNIGGNNEARRAPRSAPDGDRGGWSRPVRAASAVAPAGEYQQGQATQAPGWSRSAERRDGNGWSGNPRGWQNRGGGNWRGNNGRPEAPVQAPAAPPVQARSWNDNRAPRPDEARRPERSDSSWRQETAQGYRDANRDRNGDRWREQNRWREESRWRDANREAYRRDNDRRWDNRWRDNRRYDWHSYRRTYPSTFRVGIYYSPFRNYSYRRLNIGFFLDSLFYSNRYWINDPWQYRLPDVYGPYRWVRYYDDALLVNTYSGEVVDVIYSFFW